MKMHTSLFTTNEHVPIHWIFSSFTTQCLTKIKWTVLILWTCISFKLVSYLLYLLTVQSLFWIFQVSSLGKTYSNYRKFALIINSRKRNYKIRPKWFLLNSKKQFFLKFYIFPHFVCTSYSHKVIFSVNSEETRNRGEEREKVDINNLV